MKALKLYFLFSLFSLNAYAELPPKLFLNISLANFYFVPLPGYSNQYVYFRNGIANAGISIKYKGANAGKEGIMSIQVKCSNGTMKVFENGRFEDSFIKPKNEIYSELMKAICNEV